MERGSPFGTGGRKEEEKDIGDCDRKGRRDDEEDWKR